MNALQFQIIESQNMDYILDAFERGTLTIEYPENMEWIPDEMLVLKYNRRSKNIPYLLIPEEWLFGTDEQILTLKLKQQFKLAKN